MKATEELKEEHQAVGLMLAILGKIAQQLEVGKELNHLHFDQILDFLTGFVDHCHHTKEEELFFPAVKNIGGAQESALIEILLQEHEQGRADIKQIKEEYGQYQGQTEGLAAAIKEYINLLIRHIQKEDNQFFPMADKVLSDEQQVELLAGFEKIEEEKIGVGKHEEYHQLLDQLKQEYLTP